MASRDIHHIDQAGFIEQDIAVDARCDVFCGVAEQASRQLVHVGNLERRESNLDEGLWEMQPKLLEFRARLFQLSTQRRSLFRVGGRAR